MIDAATKKRDYQREWVRNNPDKVKAHKKRDYERHKSRYIEQSKKWIKQNPDKRKASALKYYYSHKEQYDERQKGYRLDGRRKAAVSRYYAEHREEILSRKREYYRLHPEKVAVYKARRKARMNLAEGDFTESEWLSLLSKWNRRCLACGSTENITVDHVVPLAVGGTNYIDNLQPLCRSCNCRKKDKTIDYRLDWT